MFHVRMRYLCLTVGLALMGMGNAQMANALPRYSAQYGQSCHLCHTNPTGGGLRNLYATQYIMPSELTITQLPEEEAEQLNPQIAPFLLIGLDQRTLLVEGEGEKGESTLFGMQADLYLAFQLNKKFSAYLDLGQSRTQEYFGMAYILPAHGYIKVGRFMPDFGWRTADHQTATRRFLIFPEGSDFPSSFIDSGLEVGFSAWRIDVTASMQGGTGNNGDSFTGRGVWRHSFGPLNVALGGSYLQRNQSELERSAYGGFGYLAWGQLIWLWEVDETQRTAASEAKVKGLLVSQELTLIPTRGVNVLFNYSFQDPDRELTTGARTRWGAGVDTLIYPFFGMQLMGYYFAFDRGEDVTDDDYLQAELIFHFLY